MDKNNSSKKEITLDDLALMVAKGFDEMNEKMDNGFKEVKSDISRLETTVEEIKTDVTVLKSDVTVLKSDVKDIKANLNKKVDKIDHNTLTYRVEKLEKNFAQ